MPEQSTARNRTHIDVYAEEDVAYWTSVLGVSRDRLLLAVVKVGPLVEDVRRALGKQAQGNRSPGDRA